MDTLPKSELNIAVHYEVTRYPLGVLMLSGPGYQYKTKKCITDWCAITSLFEESIHPERSIHYP